MTLHDSGDIHEEVRALGKPVLVMKENTERPDAVAAGTTVLVGLNPVRIENECVSLVTNEET